MTPLRDIECRGCNKLYERLIRNDAEWELEVCPSCGSNNLQLCLSFPSTYTIGGNNTASTRPKQMGGKK